VFIEAKDDGSVGNNWSYRSCKAPVKSSPTNQRPVFYRPDALPVAQPAVLKHWGKSSDRRSTLFIFKQGPSVTKMSGTSYMRTHGMTKQSPNFTPWSN